MKQQRRNFRSDTEAASEVIGMILLLAIFVTMFTIFQASVVPTWNKKVEADHIPAVYDDMTSLSSDIADSASRVIAKSSSIQLGARYPDRVIFRNPGPGAFGTLTVEEDVDVSVVYNAVNTREFKTSRLIYELKGTVNSPKLVYEHGIIIRDWGDGNVLGPIPPENHTLFDDCSANVYIPIVHGSSHSASSLDSKSVSIFPFAESETVADIAIIKITMDTDYPKVWEKLFMGSTNTNISAIVSDDDKIEIESTSIQKIYLPVVEDVISSDLYTGVITGTAILQDELWESGEGTDIMAMGSRVANIPSSADANAITFSNIVLDESIADEEKDDLVTILVTDINNLKWWKVLIEFKQVKQINSIELRSASGVSTYKYTTPFEFDEYTSIDLFKPLNFDIKSGIGGLYQNAGVGSDNRLVTLVGDKNNLRQTAVISFRLMVDGN